MSRIDVNPRYTVNKQGVKSIKVTSPLTKKSYVAKESSTDTSMYEIKGKFASADFNNYKVWSVLSYELNGGSLNPRNTIVPYYKSTESKRIMKDTELQNIILNPNLMVRDTSDSRQFYVTVSNPCGTGKSEGLINTIIQNYHDNEGRISHMVPLLILVADSKECNRYAKAIKEGCDNNPNVAKAYHTQGGGELVQTVRGKVLSKKLTDVESEMKMTPVIILTHARLTNTTVWIDEIAKNTILSPRDKRVIICDEKPSQPYLRYNLDPWVLLCTLTDLERVLQEEYDDNQRLRNHPTKKSKGKKTKFKVPAYITSLRKIITKSTRNKKPLKSLSNATLDNIDRLITALQTHKLDSSLDLLLDILANGSAREYKGMQSPTAIRGIYDRPQTVNLSTTERKLLLSHLKVAIFAVYLGRYYPNMKYTHGYSIYIDVNTALSICSYGGVSVLLEGTAENGPEKLSKDTVIRNTTGKSYTDKSCNVKLVDVVNHKGYKSSLKYKVTPMARLGCAINKHIRTRHPNEDILVSVPKDYSGGDNIKYTTDLKKSLESYDSESSRTRCTSWLSDKGSNEYSHITVYVAGTIFRLPDQEYTAILASMGLSTHSSSIRNNLIVRHQTAVTMQSVSRTAIRNWDGTEVTVYLPHNPVLLRKLKKAYKTNVTKLKDEFLPTALDVANIDLKSTASQRVANKIPCILRGILTVLTNSALDSGKFSVKCQEMAKQLGYTRTDSLTRYISGQLSEQDLYDTYGITYTRGKGSHPATFDLTRSKSVLKRVITKYSNSAYNACHNLSERLSDIYADLFEQLPTVRMAS